VADGARQQGWSRPAVYAEETTELADGRAPALARLEAAIPADRHHALVITGPGPAPADVLPFPVRCEAWALLARTSVEALSKLFPGWRIWLDQHGWHGRRRDAVYLQVCRDGVPAFAVHADTAASLALQLCWQQAADCHAPDGCSAR
jgi:hypothetical protein